MHNIADAPSNAKRLVLTTVTITTKKGSYITGINREHFTLKVDKAPREIKFLNHQDAPLSVGIMFDVSGSTGSVSGNNSKLAVEKLILHWKH